MAQHDQVIDNGPGLAVRTDFNAALAALFSSSAGAVEPAVKVAGQLWFNTTTGKLQMRNAANTAWASLSGELSGDVAVTGTPSTRFVGTSASVLEPLIAVRDARTTVGAEGNVVFAIKRQNSGTDVLALGNDANNAALIGGNNVPVRFGKWVSGVFTEYMNMSTAGAFTIFGGLTIDPPSGVQGLQLKQADASSARLFFESTSYTWAMMVNDAYGTLDFMSGGTYGTSSGTARLRMFENGDIRTGGSLIAVAHQIATAGVGTTVRASLVAATGAGGSSVTQRGYTDAGVEDAFLSFTNSSLTHRSVGSTPTTHNFILEDSAGQNRVALYRNATWGFLLEARDSAGVSEGYIGLEHDGELKCHDGSAAYTVVHTGNLPLMTYTGTTATNTAFPVTSTVMCWTGPALRNATVIPCIHNANTMAYIISTNGNAGTALAGTWRTRGQSDWDNGVALLQRVA